MYENTKKQDTNPLNQTSSFASAIELLKKPENLTY